MKPDFDTTIVAAEAFLAQMRREWVRENPGTECPIKTLEHYQGYHRGAILRSMQVAITAACTSPTWRATCHAPNAMRN